MGELAEKLDGKRLRAGFGVRSIVDGNLASRVAFKYTQVLAAERLEPLVGEETEPEEEGHRGELEIVLDAPRRLQERVLDDVGLIDAPAEAAVEAEHHQTLQSHSVALEESAHGASVSSPCPLELPSELKTLERESGFWPDSSERV